MAMLAEPKRKQKFSFDPRNTNWSNDESKFGHKLMEKMGWSKGKGLGANEDGKTENVAVSVKNDTRGVGCSKSHVDNWIAHQDDFNALLSNLNQNHSASNGKQDTADKKVISLEQKSRSSKGRLHYQKFTKGKDLSLKSETDLDCVFGKRKSQSGTNTPQPQSESSSDNEDPSHGFNTVTSTDSVQDYFKKKMAERLNKLAGSSGDNKEKDDVNDKNKRIHANNEATLVVEEEFDDLKTKKKKTSKKRQKKANLINDDVETVDGYAEPTEDEEHVKVQTDNIEVVKKRKKSKKRKQTEDICESVDENTTTDTRVNDEQKEVADSKEMLEEKIKKKKKKKQKLELENSSRKEPEKIDMTGLKRQIKEIKEEDNEDLPKKKMKKRKREVKDDENVVPKKKVRFLIGDDPEENSDDNLEDKTVQKAVLKADRRFPSCTDQEEIKGGTLSEASGDNVRATGKVKEDNIVIDIAEKDDNKGSQTSGNIHENSGLFNANMCGKDNSKTSRAGVHEVKLINESFRGANVKQVKGYAGLRVTSQDVKNKLTRADRTVKDKKSRR